MYTGGSKIAEHGGANPADRDVPIVVYAPGRCSPACTAQWVETTPDRPDDPEPARARSGRARSGRDRRDAGTSRSRRPLIALSSHRRGRRAPKASRLPHRSIHAEQKLTTTLNMGLRKHCSDSTHRGHCGCPDVEPGRLVCEHRSANVAAGSPNPRARSHGHCRRRRLCDRRRLVGDAKRATGATGWGRHGRPRAAPTRAREGRC